MRRLSTPALSLVCYVIPPRLAGMIPSSMNVTSCYVTTNVSHTIDTIDTYLVDGVLIAIAFMGTVGNSIALLVLSSSSRIKKTTTYVLLMNQSLLDLVTTLCTLNYIAMKYLLSWQDMSGPIGWFLCQFIYSQQNFIATTCSSSFNLVALSLERMIRVLWPIYHRRHMTRRRMRLWSAVIWVSGFVVVMSFSFCANGVGADRKCIFWSDFSSDLRTRVFYISFNVVFSLAPLLIMSAAYVMIFVRVSSRRLKVDAKLNVIRMLLTCVALFFVCHVLRASLSIASKYIDFEIEDSPVFTFSVVILQANSIVNPMVYCLQYMDYRKELINRFKMVCRPKSIYIA